MSMNVTYSPEDNKLRLYSSCRLDKELYSRVRAAGFKWAPKQELFVAPMWTPDREDLLIELCGEIDDEDTSLVDRAEMRAERFSDYSDKRNADANRAADAVHAIADNIPFGQPILVGHHSEKRARRDAKKIEDGMHRAVRMWETAEYWKYRAAGAVRAAKYKERPDVRARRIKKLEADKRKRERAKKESEKLINFYTDEKTVDIKLRNGMNMRNQLLQTYDGGLSFEDMHRVEREELTTEEGIKIALKNCNRSVEYNNRWIAHYTNRIDYEKIMLDEQGSGYLLEKSPRPKQLPLLNYREAKGFTVPNRYSVGKFIHYPQVELSSDQYKKVPPDYRGTIKIDGTHRVKTCIGCFIPEIEEKARKVIDDCEKFSLKHKYFAVFITDNKIHKKPEPEQPTQQPETSQQSEQKEIATTEQVDMFEPVQGDLFAVHEQEIKPDHNWSQQDPFTTMKPTGIRAGKTNRFEQMKEALKTGVKTVSAPSLFPTPPELCERMVELAELKPGMSVLEPSAGTGNIIQALVDEGGCTITAIEINQQLCGVLRDKFEHIKLFPADFLSFGLLGKYDRILMNPPFEKADDIKHILHAKDQLKEGGKLIAICAGGPRQEAALKPIASKWERLPSGTFRESGTNVNTVLLTIEG